MYLWTTVRWISHSIYGKQVISNRSWPVCEFGIMKGVFSVILFFMFIYTYIFYLLIYNNINFHVIS